jgi:hypothetical protein
MQAGQGKVKPVLTQVIADRNLAAKRITAPFHVERIQVIRIGLHQNRDSET